MTALDPSDVEHLVDQFQQVSTCAPDVPNAGTLLLADLELEKLGEPQDRESRAHHGR